MNHPEHICRFNDAPQTCECCECYDAGYKEALAEERERVSSEIRKRRDSLSISTTFAVMMMSQRGDAGKMAKELRELGGYQALDDLLNSPNKPDKAI